MAEAAAKMTSKGDIGDTMGRTHGRPLSKGSAPIQLPFKAEPPPGLPDMDDMIPGTSAHYLPRYQMPNISSILPSYSNSEQDFVKGAFAASDYTSLTTNLPNQIKCHSVCTLCLTRKLTWSSGRSGITFLAAAVKYLLIQQKTFIECVCYGRA
eukprot:9325622-Pyramimonas_sp.AAC.1